ncbi:MAG: LysE/ArgO family amino acid transporter [Bacteriovoracia bacterium]
MGSLFFEGLILQASLIFALGSQNLFVLEAGLKRQNHIIVSLVCFLCDLTLILLGVAGAATLFNEYPYLKILIGLLGVSFLFVYGVSKLFFQDYACTPVNSPQFEKNIKRSILLAMTFSILNPHAYLDAFILIGGFSTKYEALGDRITLGLGAAVYSGIWFLILSTMSSAMKPILENPSRMRLVMSVAGMALIFLSGKLGIDVMSWMEPLINPGLALNDWVTYPGSPGKLFTSILY